VSEFLHVKPAPEGAKCWAHDLPTDGLARRLVDEMRRTHGKDGVNVCLECIERAKAALRRK